LRRIGRNVLHLLGSQALGFGMALVASVVMARTLGPNDLGIFHQAQWFAGLMSVCLSLGLVTSVTKFTAQFRSEKRPDAAASALRFMLKVELAIGLFSTAGLVLLSSRIADYYFSPGEAGFFALAFLGLAPGLQTALYSAALEGAQIFRYQSVHALTVTPLTLIAKIGLLLGGFGLYGLLWCNLAAAVANLLFFGHDDIGHHRLEDVSHRHLRRRHAAHGHQQQSVRRQQQPQLHADQEQHAEPNGVDPEPHHDWHEHRQRDEHHTHLVHEHPEEDQDQHHQGNHRER
jgi:O-antigen/teichoic acid export membrane protein